MRILVDECLPSELSDVLAGMGHECQTVWRAGWVRKEWRAAGHRNIRYQQNMTGRAVSIVILHARSNRLEDLLPLMPACSEALISLGRGRVVEVGLEHPK